MAGGKETGGETGKPGEKETAGGSELTGEVGTNGEADPLSGIIHVYDVQGRGLTLYYDMSREHLLAGLAEEEQ